MRALLLILLFAGSLHAVTIAGASYQDLRVSAGKLALKTRVAADGKNIVLTGKTSSVQLTLNQRSSFVNGTRVWLNFPIAEIKNRFYISKIDYERTLLPLLRPSVFSGKSQRLRHIVIDPGHGGRDTGARNSRLRINEKMFTLDVAVRVQQRLEDLGYRVTLTRTTDRFVELPDRPALANSLNADLFVSIHFNSAAPSISGIETYCYTPQGAPSSSRDELSASDKVFQSPNTFDVANLWAAYEVQKSLTERLRAPDRAVRHARFIVLEGLRCPGLLVEGGFITSPSEGSRLSSSLYRQQLADAIVAGIRGYHRRIMGM